MTTDWVADPTEIDLPCCGGWSPGSARVSRGLLPDRQMLPASPTLFLLVHPCPFSVVTPVTLDPGLAIKGLP